METPAKTTPTEHDDDPELLDLAIVGAGLSGLTAAKIISDKQCGITFRLFEKSAAPGGQLGELKSRWITPHHHHALKLCRELNIPLTPLNTLPERTGTSRVLRSIGPFGEYRAVEEGFWTALHHVLARFESNRFMAELDCLCSVKHIGRSLTNMDAFLRRKLLFDDSRRFFRFLIKLGTGFSPVELTVSECLNLFRSMSSVQDLYKMLTLQGSHLHPVGSPNWDVLVERLLSKVDVGALNCNTNIVQVEISPGDQDEVVSLLDMTGRRWRARYVILAVPCLELVRINILPTRPHFFSKPDAQQGVWCMTNFTMRFPAPWWKDHGYNGSIFCPAQRLLCYDSGNNQLSGTYFSPSHAWDEETERHTIRNNILLILTDNFGCRALLQPLECSLKVLPKPFFFDVAPTFRRRLIFASSNVSCWYRGFINGSIQGGIRAAMLALLELRPQTITFEEVTDMQCIHFKYFQRRSPWTRVWYSLNFASLGRWALKSGVIILTITGCVAVLSVTWILCLTCFGMLVLPKGYYFNKTGLLACEPFYSKSSYRILSSCALYFPTTMVLMYCYGSSFHANRYRLATPSAASLSLHTSTSCGNGNTPGHNAAPTGGIVDGGVRGSGGDGDTIETLAGTTLTANGSGLEHHSCDGNTLTGIAAITPTSVSFSDKFVVEDDRRIHGSTSRTMAAISLGFIVIITPWTILEIVATCTGSKIPPSIDFCVTWIALSSSFWNPFLYWLLNARFRQICKELFTSKCTGRRSSLEEKCSISLDYDNHLTSLPLPPGPPPATICRSENHTPRPDVECSEKYWGEILERTFSTGSVNTLHRMGANAGLPFTSRPPDGQMQLQQYHCEAHQHLMRNASHTSIGREHRSVVTSNSNFRTLYSTGSDPQVCEHELHDINCAKNKAFFRGFNLHQGLPDI